MNTGKGFSKMWFLVLLLAAFVAGCGNNNNDTVAPSSAKAITAYSINGATGIISEATTPKTIVVNVPYGTIVTNVSSTFMTTGASVQVGTTAQISGTTTNNFTSPVVYTVTAADGTIATYNVTVIVGSQTTKAITSYVLTGGATGTITEGTTPKTIAVIVPYGTNKTALVATYATTGASVKVGGALQTSGTTTNNFSSPVDYVVTAADLTTATYRVTVTEAAAGPPSICTGTTGSCVDLGTAANYVIFAGTGVTYTPIATVTTTPKITGNVGVSPAAASNITGFALTLPAGGAFATSTLVTGYVFAPDYAPPTPANLTTAAGDKLIAYNAAAGKPAGAGANLDLGRGIVVSQTLAPGTYTWGTNVNITGDLTLNGNATDVWVFQITGTLDLANAMSIVLSGGALPQNVFWQVSGIVTLGTTAHMEGVILSASTIALNTGATVKGRLLAADAAAVTMDSNTVTQP